MPPPSWAKRATKEAPKARPTIQNAVSATAGNSGVFGTKLETTQKTISTPRRPSETTRKPETAPPRRATVNASPRLRRAAEAVRTFDRTATYMPIQPDKAERKAP